MKKKNGVPVIAISGGPCGGKTTILTHLQEKLSDFGFKVFIKHETATEFITSGFTPPILGQSFQKELLRFTIQHEDMWQKMASTIPGKVVILADRGTMDGKAYVPASTFEQTVGQIGTHEVNLRDKRYVGVIFLRSVAVGRPDLYTCENNPARGEKTPEEAAALDSRTEAAWMGVPHLCIIGNEGDMEVKKRKALQATCRLLGIPVPTEIERKFLVILNGTLRLPPSAVSVHITQHYLKNRNPGSERIRKRSQDGGVTYYHTIKEDIRPGVRLEQERLIEAREYFSLLDHVHPDFAAISKRRTCFVSNDQYYELDEFQRSPDIILEIETTEENEEIILPNIGDCRFVDVTNNAHFSNAGIARRLANECIA